MTIGLSPSDYVFYSVCMYEHVFAMFLCCFFNCRSSWAPWYARNLPKNFIYVNRWQSYLKSLLDFSILTRWYWFIINFILHTSLCHTPRVISIFALTHVNNISKELNPTFFLSVLIVNILFLSVSLW